MYKDWIVSFSRIIFACFLTSSLLYPQSLGHSGWNTGADIYSRYIWRGTSLGQGPVIQPSLKYSKGIFTAGCWGSFDFRNYQEADLYFSFDLTSGLSLGLTDYYFPAKRYFDYSASSGTHAIEVNLSYIIKSFGMNANYIINKAGGAGSFGSDIYVQASYSLKPVKLFAGAGNGWHTYDPDKQQHKFNVCNIGIVVVKNIIVTDSFIIPLTGQLIFNPDREQLFVVVGLTI